MQPKRERYTIQIPRNTELFYSNTDSSETIDFYESFYANLNVSIKEILGILIAHFLRYGNMDNIAETEFYEYMLGAVELDNGRVMGYYGICPREYLDLMISHLSSDFQTKLPRTSPSNDVISVNAEFKRELEEFDEYELHVWYLR